MNKENQGGRTEDQRRKDTEQSQGSSKDRNANQGDANKRGSQDIR